MEKKVKKRRSMPTAYSILLLLIVAIALLSHGIPGVKGASLADVVMAIPSGFLDAIDVCLFILILGAFLGLTGGTGALEAGIAHVVRRFQGREMILIPILMFLFSIGGTTYGMAEETMAFYALITATMIAAGFDAMVGAAVILVGAGVGVLGSTVNPFAVSAAIDAIQGSGRGIVIDQGIILLIGTVLWLICLTAGIWFVMRYAARVRKQGRSILSPAELQASRETYAGAEEVRTEEKIEKDGTITAKEQLTRAQKASLILFAISFLIMVVSLIPWKSFGVTIFERTAWLTGIDLGEWYFQELQAWFLLASILMAVIARIPERKAIDSFVRGAADMIGVVFVIAVSRAISVLMQSTGLDQYVLAYASQTLGDVSPVLFVVTGYVIYLGLSFLIPSTSGLAAVSMPTFGGLAAELGFRPEVMIMIFCAASGLVNLVTPTSAVVMGGLSICRIEWTTWLKFIAGFLAILLVISLVVLSAAIFIL